MSPDAHRARHGVDEHGRTFGGFTLPIVVGYMIGGIERTGGDWNQVLYLIAGIYWTAALAWFFVNPKKVPPAWR